MMQILKTGLGLVGLGGAGLSSGWLIAGAVAAVLAILGGTWKAGYNYRATLDEAASLRLENQRLQASAEETSRQLQSVNEIQQRDANRADALAKQLKDKEDATPQITCDPPAVAPVGVRRQPPAKGVRSTSPKHSSGATGRGQVRPRPNKPSGEVDSGGSEPAVECRPGFAC